MRTDVITPLLWAPKAGGASAVCGNKLTSCITVVTLRYIPYNVSYNHSLLCIQTLAACLARKIDRGLLDASAYSDYGFRHSSISQSTDNEVGALLCVSSQIDSSTFDQPQETSVEVQRSKTLVGEISVGVRRSKTLVGEISVGVRRSKTLVREISVGVRRLKVPVLGLIANLTRLPCASATALGIVDPQVLLGVYLDARVTFITQW